MVKKLLSTKDLKDLIIRIIVFIIIPAVLGLVTKNISIVPIIGWIIAWVLGILSSLIGILCLVGIVLCIVGFVKNNAYLQRFS